MNTYKLTVSSPDGTVFQDEVFELSLRGASGDLAVLAGHIPFTTSVMNAPCAVWLDESTKKTATTDGGLLNVGAESVTLLSGSFKFDE